VLALLEEFRMVHPTSNIPVSLAKLVKKHSSFVGSAGTPVIGELELVLD
jgi:hypothetical protein